MGATSTIPSALSAPRSITFFVPAAQPGTNGVGDYALQLAAALQKCGVAASVLAWREPDLAKVIDTHEHYAGSSIPVLYLPESTNLETKLKTARQWLRQQQTDTLSLQFSGYGYDRHGMAWRIFPTLRKLLQGSFPADSSARRLKEKTIATHIYFHEIWVGLELGASWRHRLVGQLQRLSIQTMFRKLAPLCAHTNNPVYAFALNMAGISASYLPLAATIPVLATIPRGFAFPDSLKPLAIDNRDLMKVVMFGSIQPNFNIPLAVSGLAELAKLSGKELFACHLGKLDASGKARWDNFSTVLKECIPGATAATAGTVEAPTVSVALHRANLALSATPWLLVDKSSAVAAFREHGLPVWVVAKPWETRHSFHVPLPPAEQSDFSLSSQKLLWEPSTSAPVLWETLRLPRKVVADAPDRLAHFFLSDLAGSHRDGNAG